MDVNNSPFITRQELATMLKVSPRSVSKLLKRKKVPVVRLGRKIRIPAQSLDGLTGG